MHLKLKFWYTKHDYIHKYLYVSTAVAFNAQNPRTFISSLFARNKHNFDVSTQQVLDTVSLFAEVSTHFSFILVEIGLKATGNSPSGIPGNMSLEKFPAGILLRSALNFFYANFEFR